MFWRLFASWYIWYLVYIKQKNVLPFYIFVSFHCVISIIKLNSTMPLSKHIPTVVPFIAVSAIAWQLLIFFDYLTDKYRWNIFDYIFMYLILGMFLPKLYLIAMPSNQLAVITKNKSTVLLSHKLYVSKSEVILIWIKFMNTFFIILCSFNIGIVFY